MSRQIICVTEPNTVVEHLDVEALTLGKRNALYLGNSPELHTLCTETLSLQRYAHCLGQEFDYVIYDMTNNAGFRLQSILAVSGTIKANGKLLIIESQMTTAGLAMSYPYHEQSVTSYIWSFLKKQFKATFGNNPSSEPHLDPQKESISSLKTQQQVAIIEQTNALDKIQCYLEQSDTEHNHVVIMAKRGRGKSHLLARLAYQLLETGQSVLCVQQHLKDNAVLKSTLEALSDAHIPINEKIPIYQGVLAFTSVDNPLLDAPWDVVIIDEAATYSLSVLEKLHTLKGNHIYSTTTHGYEGTGQGFKRIFIDALSGYLPIELHTAFRFHQPCPLEQALSLNTQEQIELTDGVHWVDVRRLPEVLLACYGLLSEAHYQTRPDDLQRLFDCPFTHVLVYVEQSKVYGVLTYFVESLANAEIELKSQITSGERRVQGHLGIQQIAHTYHTTKVLNETHWRIHRIAVHPDKRRQQIGSQLVQHLLQKAKAQDNAVTSSFAYQRDVLAFWEHVGFRIIRVGQQTNTSSGIHNILVMHKANSHFLQKYEALIHLQSAWAKGSDIHNELKQCLLPHSEHLWAIVGDFKDGKRHFDHTEYVLYGLIQMNQLNSITLERWFNSKSLQVKERYRVLQCHGKSELIKRIKNEI